ncbi:major facilitator superfamily domain-containing protein [Desarmillaria tabescens]|uniref:Major facilitator superfamily domain-containing protein n=1 Tax=Armillaria tabescens TaxID=1929756 RepID=A0AA39MZL6_ARMTA|nr:major facilitator superfamily domain-containing protein [Desarmillaria tabescens]KAK0452013.1 major facilitator superfamily domain-containing protein [Desarmillaria tabescens]
MSSTPTKDLGLIPIPRRLRYNPAKPFQFGIGLNVLFAFACTFMIANLFYCLPLLIQYSESFGVSYFGSSKAPTLLQARYATGLFFLAPLGDVIRRRQLLLGLTVCSIVLTLCLALVRNWDAFLAISFLAGALNVVPPILLPLAADIAPSSQRTFVVSVIVSGLIMGILVSRVVAGVIAQFTEWQMVYYFAVGVQSVVLAACYAMVPDYSAKNAENMGYWGLMKSMILLSVGEPQLIQAYFVNLLSSAGLSNFWVTLIFLLGGPPYNYSTLLIGLFGSHRYVWGMHDTIRRSTTRQAASMAWFDSGLYILWVLSDALGQRGWYPYCSRDFGYARNRRILPDATSLASNVHLQHLRSSYHTFECYLSYMVFLGQVMGADVGSHVFLEYGWRAGTGLSLGWTGLGLLILLMRGPHCGRKTWFGNEGGFGTEKIVEQGDREIGMKGSVLSGLDNNSHT